jgi:hypothetical protein
MDLLEPERAFVLESTSVPAAGSWGGRRFVFGPLSLGSLHHRHETALRKSGAPELFPVVPPVYDFEPPSHFGVSDAVVQLARQH